MKKLKTIIGVIFCLMALLSVVAASLISSLHYDLNVIDLQLYIILLHGLLVATALFIPLGAIFIAYGICND